MHLVVEEEKGSKFTVSGCDCTLLIGDFNAKDLYKLDKPERLMGPLEIGVRKERGSTLIIFLTQHRQYLIL